MELKELYDKFISEGCNRFYIEGVGGPQSDDVEVLGLNNGTWEVCYMERGRKSTPMFSSKNKSDAIEFYSKHVLSIKHHHLVVMTRNEQKINEYKQLFIENNIEFLKNDIPHYSNNNDLVFRLFVFGKSIFKVQELDKSLPFRDENLK